MNYRLMQRWVVWQCCFGSCFASAWLPPAINRRWKCFRGQPLCAMLRLALSGASSIFCSPCRNFGPNRSDKQHPPFIIRLLMSATRGQIHTGRAYECHPHAHTVPTAPHEHRRTSAKTKTKEKALMNGWMSPGRPVSALVHAAFVVVSRRITLHHIDPKKGCWSRDTLGLHDVGSTGPKASEACHVVWVLVLVMVMSVHLEQHATEAPERAAAVIQASFTTAASSNVVSLAVEEADNSEVVHDVDDQGPVNDGSGWPRSSKDDQENGEDDGNGRHDDARVVVLAAFARDGIELVALHDLPQKNSTAAIAHPKWTAAGLATGAKTIAPASSHNISFRRLPDFHWLDDNWACTHCNRLVHGRLRMRHRDDIVLWIWNLERFSLLDTPLWHSDGECRAIDGRIEGVAFTEGCWCDD
mmetsp:Transcript_10131/g.27756  ORF Transcript_10131/g.27756 Transcript_10131/m.27756 type:complete len:413 (+) Transcript_10131:38-1276(+)